MPAPIAPTGRAEDVRADSAKGGDDPPNREVVVGVDGSEVGLGAVRWAAQEAARRGAPLRILHAAPYLGRGGASGAPPPELPRARGITAVAYTVARHTEPSVQSSTEVVPGDPATSLLRAAAAGQLVVLGSSATGAADEMVLAKLAARVAGHSPAPVVVVPRRRGGEPVDRPVVAVLGVGEQADDEAVATFAATTAQRLGVPVSVLQTRGSRHSVPRSWVDDLSAWAQRFPDLEVEHADLPDARANQVLGEAGPSPLMVISAGHGTLLHRSVDGPHLWLLRHCTSPMALVPAVNRSERDVHEGAGAPG
jgi:nucleotide-binding universal stress UspA family protein